MTAKDHNKLLSIFFFVQAGLQALGGIIAVIIYGVFGTAMLANSRDQEAQFIGGIFIFAAVVVGIFIIGFAAFYFFAGWKMYKEQKIGRILGIIGSILCLLSIPLGTALGIYGLWFLFGEQGKQFYEGGNIASHNPPPPPNSWQS